MYGKNTSENTTDRLTVHLNGEPVYDIVMTQDFNGLQEEVRKHVSASGKLCIVTDSTVSELYLREVAEILSSCCSSVISYVFPAGEAHKNLSTVQKLYERLILERFDRSDMLVASGAGSWAISAALPPPPICAEFLLSRFQPPCSPRWTAVSAEKQALISTLTKIWSALSICRNSFIRISEPF